MSNKRNVAAEKWSSIQNRMKGNPEEARSLNTFIDIMRSRVNEIQKDLVDEGKELTAESIKNFFARYRRQKKDAYFCF